MPIWGGTARLAFSPDGRYLAAATGEFRRRTFDRQLPEVIVWDVRKGKVVANLRAMRGPVTGRAMFEGNLRYWGAFNALAWHPDGRHLAVGTKRDVRIFDVAALVKEE
jgi:WD40 repeat protein